MSQAPRSEPDVPRPSAVSWIRRALATVLFIAIAVACGNPIYLTLVPIGDRARLHRAYTVMPDRGGWWPDYPAFLDAVRAQTKPGDTITLVVPKMKWDEGYSYAYYRASYFLAGRRVLPLVLDHDVPHPENLAAAQYVAAWGARPPGAWRVVLRAHHGELLQR